MGGVVTQKRECVVWILDWALNATKGGKGSEVRRWRQERRKDAFS